MAGARTRSSDKAIADAILAAPTTYAHVLGTCSMGQAGADWAVVDQRGSVHGLEGLHVVDASIMPTIPAVPPNMTVIMMAERCADFLREELAGPAPTAAAGAPAVQRGARLASDGVHHGALSRLTSRPMIATRAP